MTNAMCANKDDESRNIHGEPRQHQSRMAASAKVARPQSIFPRRPARRQGKAARWPLPPKPSSPTAMSPSRSRPIPSMRGRSLGRCPSSPSIEGEGRAVDRDALASVPGGRAAGARRTC
jgi:hypothetical protein